MFQIFLDLFLARLSEQTEPKEKEVSAVEIVLRNVSVWHG